MRRRPEAFPASHPAPSALLTEELADQLVAKL
jgi:hypothetical protein